MKNTSQDLFLVLLMAFTRIFLVEHIKILPRSQGMKMGLYKSEHIIYLLEKLNFLNYMKEFFGRIISKVTRSEILRENKGYLLENRFSSFGFVLLSKQTHEVRTTLYRSRFNDTVNHIYNL